MNRIPCRRTWAQTAVLPLVTAACWLTFATVQPAVKADELTSISFDLWRGDTAVPKYAELSTLKDVEFQVIKAKAFAEDGYKWLHGVALAWHKGVLYASFGHNRGAENTASEEARGCVSRDGGRSWSEVTTIDDGAEPDLAVSHGVFLSHAGTLWAFHGAFSGKLHNVHTRAYTLDEATGVWTPKGIVVTGGFWPMQEPQRMADGNWIMSGFVVGRKNPAAAAISQGDDLLQWDLVEVPQVADLEMWGESTVIVDGNRIINVARCKARAVALVAISEDYGRTWTESRPGNLPMATSKPYAGTLSTGQCYLIGTTTADSGGRRSPLTIAYGRPGENFFCRVCVIRHAIFDGESRQVASSAEARLSYPYAVEHAGRLYVGYSNSGNLRGNLNDAELAVIPLTSLRID